VFRVVKILRDCYKFWPTFSTRAGLALPRTRFIRIDVSLSHFGLKHTSVIVDDLNKGSIT
jgi:hypothetical protein